MLTPYRVLDLTDERGPLAGSMLCELGADVLLIGCDRDRVGELDATGALD